MAPNESHSEDIFFHALPIEQSIATFATVVATAAPTQEQQRNILSSHPWSNPSQGNWLLRPGAVNLELGLRSSGAFSPDFIAMCSDPRTLMLPRHLAACLALAATAVMVKHGALQVNYTGSQEALANIGVNNVTTIPGERILAQAVECLKASCDVNTTADCPKSMQSLRDVSAISGESLFVIEKSLCGYCGNRPAPYDPDIAGPGVFISLLIQSVIALGASIIFKLLTGWLTWCFLHVGCLSRCSWQLDQLRSRA